MGEWVGWENEWGGLCMFFGGRKGDWTGELGVGGGRMIEVVK